MSIQRPKSPDQIYQETLERRRIQMENLKALEESLLAKKTADHEQAMLESNDGAIEAAVKKETELSDMEVANRKNIIKKKAMESLNHLKADGMRKVTDKVLFEIVYESLWVDDEVKQEEVQTMFECYKDTSAFLQRVCPNAFKTPRTKITAGFDAVIEATVNEACDRIIKVYEAAVKNDDYTEELLSKLRFNLTPEEETKMDEKLADLGQNQIVNLVKKKVLNVVQDEKKRGLKRAELFDELDAATKDEEEEEQTEEPTDDTSGEEETSETGEEEDAAETSDDVGEEEDNAPDESSTEESTNLDEDGGEGVEEIAKHKTFWGKRMAKLRRRKGYMESDDEHEDGESKAIESLLIQQKVREINRNGATTIFEGLNMFNRMVAKIEFEQNSSICGLAVEEASIPQIISTSAMMQTLMQYTVMETLNTLKYCNLNTTDANQIRMNLNKMSSKTIRNIDAAMESVNLTLCSQL